VTTQIIDQISDNLSALSEAMIDQISDAQISDDLSVRV
jgi:hypothetical protein